MRGSPCQHAWFRALDHARLTGVKPFWRVGDYYTVDSPRAGDRYEIRRVLRKGVIAYTCTCRAAQTGNLCWHRALVAALPYEVKLRMATEDDMKLELKIAGGAIKEPGYYLAECTDAAVIATGKLEEDGTPSMLLELHCTVEYQGGDVEAKTGQYLTLGPDSKLTKLLLACGYAPTYDAVVDRYSAEGLDTDFFRGKRFRIGYTTTAGKNGRSWVKDSDYAPISKRPAFGAAPQQQQARQPPAVAHDDDDVPF